MSKKVWRNLESIRRRPQEVIMDHPVFNEGFSYVFHHWTLVHWLVLQNPVLMVQCPVLKAPASRSRDLMDLGHPGTHIVSSRTIKAVRKDVLAKCYGGDISRLSAAERSMERWEDWEGATVFSNKQGGCQQLDHDKS